MSDIDSSVVDSVAASSKSFRTNFAFEPSLYIPTFLALISGVVASVIIFGLLRANEIERIHLIFDRTAGDEWQLVDNSINSELVITGIVRSYFRTSKSITRDQFSVFTQEFLNKRKSIKTLEWIPKVTFAQKQEYEAAARSDGLAEFRISEHSAQGKTIPVGTRKEYFPIYYVEPYKGNEFAAGFDLASNKRWLSALNRARDTGQQTATAKIILDQKTGKQSGILIFDPVYEDGVKLTSVQERRENLIGFSLVVLRIGTLVESALQSTSIGLQVRILDVTDANNHEVLYQSSNKISDTYPFIYTNKRAVAGRIWQMEITPGPGYQASQGGLTPWTVFILCLLLSVALAVYLFQLLGTRERISQQVELKTHALQESESRLEGLVTSTQKARDLAETALAELASHKFALDEHSIVAVTDTSGTIIYANDKFCEISKYHRDELIGANHRIINSGHHTDAFFKKMYKTIAKGKTWRAEFKNKAKDGSYYWVDTTISPFKDANGKVIQYVAIRTDITKTKQTEEALEHSIEDLERANVDLKRFAYVASHDLQEPLRKLQQFTDFLATDCADKLSGDGKYFLDVITSSSSRMSTLIRDLLAYSRTTNSNLKPMKINLSEATDGILAELDMAITESNATIKVDALPTITADPAAVDHLIRNLIGNAIKYRDPSRDPVIKVSSKRLPKDGAIELQIADNGIGFDMQYSKRILEPFQRLHDKNEYAGSGIGLTVCNTICKRHGWKLSANSKPGKGSRFSVLIPTDGAS